MHHDKRQEIKLTVVPTSDQGLDMVGLMDRGGASSAIGSLERRWPGRQGAESRGPTSHPSKLQSRSAGSAVSINHKSQNDGLADQEIMVNVLPSKLPYLGASRALRGPLSPRCCRT